MFSCPHFSHLQIPGNSCAKTLEFLLQIFGMIYCKLTNAQQRQEQRHRELIQALSESKRINETPVKRKQVRRRFAMDKAGNLLGEEITEEVVEG